MFCEYMFFIRLIVNMYNYNYKYTYYIVTVYRSDSGCIELNKNVQTKY